MLCDHNPAFGLIAIIAIALVLELEKYIATRHKIQDLQVAGYARFEKVWAG